MSIKLQPIKKHTNLYDWTLKAQPAPPHNCTKHGQILGIDLTTHTRNYPKPNLGIQHTKKTVSKISEKLKRAAALQITKYQSSQQLNLNRRHARRNLNAPTTKKNRTNPTGTAHPNIAEEATASLAAQIAAHQAPGPEFRHLPLLIPPKTLRI
jgi:hypothetical protein